MTSKGLVIDVNRTQAPNLRWNAKVDYLKSTQEMNKKLGRAISEAKDTTENHCNNDSQLHEFMPDIFVYVWQVIN